jgi:hypothetical protein
MDYGILNTLQVDTYGNINSTALGDYEASTGASAGRAARTPSLPLLEDAAHDRPAEAEVRAASGLHLLARVSRWLAERPRACGPAA